MVVLETRVVMERRKQAAMGRRCNIRSKDGVSRWRLAQDILDLGLS